MYREALKTSEQLAKHAQRFYERESKYFLLFAIHEVDDLDIDEDCDDDVDSFELINGPKDKKQILKEN